MAEKFQYSREWTDEKAFPQLSFSKNWENPEDYPTYEPDETQVRKDMQSLHDEVKDYLNDVLIPAVLSEDATESARAEAEEARQTAETARQDAESARATAEAERAAAEAARQSQESERQTNEAGRVASEDARVTAEENRVTAESERVTAEASRASAESARVTQESARAEAERTRVATESARAEAEEARQTAETARQDAESARATAEAERAAAEAARCVWEDYDETKSYIPGNKVAYQGSSYVNRLACTGVSPLSTKHWQLIARKGMDGEDGGKSAYQQAVDGGYKGTEEEFNVLLANIGQSVYLKNQDYVRGIQSDNIYDFIYGNGVYLLVGDNNEDSIYRSTNLKDWRLCTDVVGSNGKSYDADPVACYGDGRFVAICGRGLNLGAYVSTDAEHWGLYAFDGAVDFKAEGTEFDLRGLCYGNGAFVAVIRDYDSGITYSVRSTDGGETWTTHEMPTLETRAYFLQFDGTQFIFGLSDGQLYCSTDGIAWTQKNGLTSAISAVSTNFDFDGLAATNGLIVAYCYCINKSSGNFRQLFYSTDGGDTWNVSTNLGVNRLWLSAHDGRVFMATGKRNGDGDIEKLTIESTTDGVTWSSLGEIIKEGSNVTLLKWENDRFWIYDNESGDLYYSFDGKTWVYNTEPPYLATTDGQPLPEMLKDVVVVQIKYDGDRDCYVPNYAPIELYQLGYEGKAILAQYDGDTFILSDLYASEATFVQLGDSADSPLRYKITIKDNGEVVREEIKSNVLSLNTINTDLPDHGAYTSVCFGNGMYRAVAADGKNVYSRDGKRWYSGLKINWTTEYDAAGIVYGNGRFVAVCGDAYAYTDDDDYYWTTGTLTDFRSCHIVYGADKFVAAGYGGVRYSADGITWTAVELPQMNGEKLSLNSIRYDKNKFIGIDDYGYIAESEDGITWTVKNGLYEVFTYNDANVYWDCLAYNGSTYVAGGHISADSFGGDSDAPCDSGPFAAYSSDGETWQMAKINPLRSWKGYCAFEEIIVNSKTNGFTAVIFDSEHRDSGEIVWSYSDGTEWYRPEWVGEPYGPNWSSLCEGSYAGEHSDTQFFMVAVSYGTEDDVPMYGGVAAYYEGGYGICWYCTSKQFSVGGSSVKASDVQNQLMARVLVDGTQVNDEAYMEAYAKEYGFTYDYLGDTNLKITCDYSAQELAKAAMSGKTVSLLHGGCVCPYVECDHTGFDVGENSYRVNYARFQLDDEDYIDVLEDKTVVFMKKPDVVSTAEQWLEEEEKAQARENIGAASKAELEAIATSAGSGYTKEETLTSETAAMYGLGENAVPNEALAYLGRYTEYWWKLQPLDFTVTFSETKSRTFNHATSMIVYYSDEIEYDSRISAKLKNPASLTITTYGATQISNNVKGKYFTVDILNTSSEHEGILYFMPATADAENGSSISTTIYCQIVTITSTNAGDANFVQSPVRDTYPDSGVIDDILYEYCGIPLDNAVMAPRVENGSYVGTGAAGADNPNSLVFDFQPKAIVISAESDYTGIIHLIFDVTKTYNSSYTSTSNIITVDWSDDKQVKWYDASSNSSCQLNVANKMYHYTAIG